MRRKLGIVSPKSYVSEILPNPMKGRYDVAQRPIGGNDPFRSFWLLSRRISHIRNNPVLGI